MLRSIEAIVEPNGVVRLLETIEVNAATRAIVTLLDDTPILNESALLSEAALAVDWNRPEEDAAWSYLQPDK